MTLRKLLLCGRGIFRWHPLLLGMPGLGLPVAWAQTTVSQAVSTKDPVGVRLAGSIADPSGAFIPGATLLFAPLDPRSSADADASNAIKAGTDSEGRFSVLLAAGTYQLTVTAEGFTPLSRRVVVGLRPAPLTLQLASATSTAEVNVSADNAVSTGNADNQSALVFRTEQLNQLSDNDTLLQQEVTAMAGGTGEGGGQLYINGFSGGQFPPKDSIREIRINQDPFSAQYDSLGYGRIEIFTKPGSDKLHGDFFSTGSTKAFNTLNPYTGQQPDYFLLFNRGDLNGPIGKKTSFFLAGNRGDIHNNAVVNAFNPDGSPLSEAVPAPQSNDNYSVRIDRQLTKNNTFVGRYEYVSTSASNSGVGQLVLPTEGATTGSNIQTLQLSNTELIGPNIVSESRFQFLRTHATQTPNSTAVSNIVQGAFSNGGSPSQASDDLQDQYEFQEYLSVSRGAHFLQIGARYRLLHEVNTSTANYNGQYTFSSLAEYQAVVANQPGATPDLFTINAGQPTATLLMGDLGAYAQDEWKLRKNLTASFGLRLESQSAVPDHLDPAPRAGISWAVGQREKRGPLFVLRGGAGIFYQRFASTNILTSIRQNGSNQQQYQITAPTFYPDIPDTTQLTGASPVPYRIDPNLRIASTMIASIEVDRTLGKYGQVSATYYNQRGVHQYNSANLNAPRTDGTRPMGGSANVYEFQSAGISKTENFSANTQLTFGKRLTFFAYYGARRQNNDTFGSTSFPSQPYNLSADYGPSGYGFQPVAQRLFAAANFTLPASFHLSLFTANFSRTRFNITTGTDRNNDTQFNDRPAFATNPGPSSVIYTTAYGAFDANPQPGEAIVPYNYALGPHMNFLGVDFNRDFKFGPRGAAPTPPPGSLKPGQPTPKGEPRYTWNIAIEAENALNSNNAGTPVGVLTSPNFGRSISTNNQFGVLSAANRVIFLDTSFRF